MEGRGAPNAELLQEALQRLFDCCSTVSLRPAFSAQLASSSQIAICSIIVRESAQQNLVLVWVPQRLLGCSRYSLSSLSLPPLPTPILAVARRVPAPLPCLRHPAVCQLPPACYIYIVVGVLYAGLLQEAPQRLFDCCFAVSLLPGSNSDPSPSCSALRVCTSTLPAFFSTQTQKSTPSFCDNIWLVGVSQMLFPKGCAEAACLAAPQQSCPSLLLV